jgi:hypothetical protein
VVEGHEDVVADVVERYEDGGVGERRQMWWKDMKVAVCVRRVGVTPFFYMPLRQPFELNMRLEVGNQSRCLSRLLDKSQVAS